MKLVEIVGSFLEGGHYEKIGIASVIIKNNDSIENTPRENTLAFLKEILNQQKYETQSNSNP